MMPLLVRTADGRRGLVVGYVMGTEGVLAIVRLDLRLEATPLAELTVINPDTEHRGGKVTPSYADVIKTFEQRTNFTSSLPEPVILKDGDLSRGGVTQHRPYVDMDHTHRG